MSRLGIDFGTTRTIVSLADHGNYPLALFEDEAGDAHCYFPSVVAWEDGRLLAGHTAVAALTRGAPALPNFKRLLSGTTPLLSQHIELGDACFSLLEILTEFLRQLRAALPDSSIGERLDTGAPLEAMVAVPAQAYSAQRFITLQAFDQAGFDVVGMLNEPSAAAFEFAHSRSRQQGTRVLIYDFGGGTFDASLIEIEGHRHEVLATAGDNHLGGEDMDAILVDLALQAAGKEPGALPAAALADLHWQAKLAKEALVPQSRRILLDVDGQDVTVPVADFYAAVAPLVERSIETMAPLLGEAHLSVLREESIAGLYVVGGSSALPLVPRALRERFGRRVLRSPLPAGSVAVGLAIAGDELGYEVRDLLSRGFGVFRESDAGQTVSFDPILSSAQELPTTGTLTVSRRYEAVHNVGHFQFVEYRSLGADGLPQGDISPFARVVHPFAAHLYQSADLADVAVEPARGTWVEESYEIGSDGLVRVTISHADGFSRAYDLQLA
ncbi:MAG: Hsp70 family protein [Buchananella hordeovulneris]|nr:Hsp70 family protein [Buchananella hordeovulneris]